MAQVSVTIDGRKYRLACNEGEEARLEQLADMIDAKILELRQTFGEIGDQRLVVMAALTIADNLAEARDEAIAQREHAERGLGPGRIGRHQPRRARREAREPGDAAGGRPGGLSRRTRYSEA